LKLKLRPINGIQEVYSVRTFGDECAKCWPSKSVTKFILSEAEAIAFFPADFRQRNLRVPGLKRVIKLEKRCR